MARKMVAYQGWIIASPRWENRHRDGRSLTQCEVAVLAPSMTAASRALTEQTGSHYGVRHIKNYVSAETGNKKTLDALAQHSPLTVLVAPMDPGGTIFGQTEWVALKDHPDG